MISERSVASKQEIDVKPPTFFGSFDKIEGKKFKISNFYDVASISLKIEGLNALLLLSSCDTMNGEFEEYRLIFQNLEPVELTVRNRFGKTTRNDELYTFLKKIEESLATAEVQDEEISLTGINAYLVRPPRW